MTTKCKHCGFKNFYRLKRFITKDSCCSNCGAHGMQEKLTWIEVQGKNPYGETFSDDNGSFFFALKNLSGTLYFLINDFCYTMKNLIDNPKIYENGK